MGIFYDIETMEREGAATDGQLLLGGQTTGFSEQQFGGWLSITSGEVTDIIPLPWFVLVEPLAGQDLNSTFALFTWDDLVSVRKLEYGKQSSPITGQRAFGFWIPGPGQLVRWGYWKAMKVRINAKDLRRDLGEQIGESV